VLRPHSRSNGHFSLRHSTGCPLSVRRGSCPPNFLTQYVQFAAVSYYERALLGPDRGALPAPRLAAFPVHRLARFGLAGIDYTFAFCSQKCKSIGSGGPAKSRGSRARRAAAAGPKGKGPPAKRTPELRCQFFGLSCSLFLVNQTGYRLRFLTKNVVITAYLAPSMRRTPLRMSAHGKRPRPELARKAPGSPSRKAAKRRRKPKLASPVKRTYNGKPTTSVGLASSLDRNYRECVRFEIRARYLESRVWALFSGSICWSGFGGARCRSHG
jgi:hypothetical protein